MEQPTNQHDETSDGSRVKSLIGNATLLAAKQAELAKLTSVTLPKLYHTIGKWLAAKTKLPPELSALRERVQTLEAALSAPPQTPAGPTEAGWSAKAKLLAQKAARATSDAATSVQLTAALVALGREATSKYGDKAVPSDLAPAFSAALSKKAALEDEILQLRASKGVGVFTPSRILIGAACGALFLLGSLFFRGSGTTGTFSGGDDQDVANELREVTDTLRRDADEMKQSIDRDIAATSTQINQEQCHAALVVAWAEWSNAKDRFLRDLTAATTEASSGLAGEDSNVIWKARDAAASDLNELVEKKNEALESLLSDLRKKIDAAFSGGDASRQNGFAEKITQQLSSAMKAAVAECDLRVAQHTTDLARRGSERRVAMQQAQASDSAAQEQSRKDQEFVERLGDIHALTSLNATDAAVLARHTEIPLYLDALSEVPVDVARALASVKHGLRLAAVEHLAPEAADALGKIEVGKDNELELPSLQELTSAPLARALARNNTNLVLKGVKTLSAGAAKELAAFEGYLDLSSIASLPEETAAALGDGNASTLVLSGLRVLDSPALARAISKGRTANLNECERISDAAAEVLAASDCNLSLPALKELSSPQLTRKLLKQGHLERLSGLMANEKLKMSPTVISVVEEAQLAKRTKDDVFFVGQASLTDDEFMQMLDATPSHISGIDIQKSTKLTAKCLRHILRCNRLTELRIGSDNTFTAADLADLESLQLSSITIPVRFLQDSKALASVVKMLTQGGALFARRDQRREFALRLADCPNNEGWSEGTCNFSDTAIGDDLLRVLAGIKGIKAVVLPASITDGGLAHLAAIPDLESVDVVLTPKVTDKGFGHLAACKRLKSLRCDLADGGPDSGSHITANGLAKLTGMGLREVRLPRALHRSECLKAYLDSLSPEARHFVHLGEDPAKYARDLWPITRETAAVIAVSRGIESVEIFGSPGGTKLTDEMLRMIGTAPDVTEIALHNVSITGEGFDGFADSRKLKCIDLVGCRSLTDGGLAAIAKVHRLIRLRVRESPRITNTGAMTLSACKFLNECEFSACGVTSTVAVSLTSAIPGCRVNVRDE